MTNIGAAVYSNDKPIPMIFARSVKSYQYQVQMPKSYTHRASASEHGERIGERLQEDTEDDDDSTRNNCQLATNLLDEPPQEEHGEDTAQSLSAVEDA